jgi:hypothetical protein
MNPEDGELIGFMEIAIKRSRYKKDEVRAKRLEAKSEQLQILGMSRWVKGELTHLALRLGHRNKQTIDLSSDVEDIEPDATTTS